MDKEKNQEKSVKKKSKSSISFFCCTSSTKKKKSQTHMPNNNNNNPSEKSISHNFSSFNHDNDKEKEKDNFDFQEVPISAKIDNSSNNNTMIINSAEKPSNNYTINNKVVNKDQSDQPKLNVSQIKEEQMICPIKEEDIHLDFNKSIPINLGKSNQFESKVSTNPIIDPSLSLELIKQNEEDEEPNEEADLDIKNQDNPIKMNLEYKIKNDINSESKRSECSNDAIALTEQTPSRGNNDIQFETIEETKEIFSTRIKQNNINNTDKYKPCTPSNHILKDKNIKPIDKTDTNVIHRPIKEKIILDRSHNSGIEGIEFGVKKNQNDNQSIQNEIIHKQIDVKSMNCSMIVNTNKNNKVPFISSNSNKVYQNVLNPELNISSPIIDQKNYISKVKSNVTIHDLQQRDADDTDNEIKSKQSLNYINNNCEDYDSRANLSEDIYFIEGDELRDNKDGVSRYSENHSVISSYVLTVPKMISGINETYAPSIYTRSEYKDTTSNFLPTESTNNLRLIPTNVDDTEFEITNENGEGFCNFIETPRTSNVIFRKPNRDYSNVNPQFKEIYDKINHKEKEIKRLNEKITKLMSNIQKCEEENKKYDRWIEKEESDGEMLRHMLNFLNSK